MNKLEYLQSLYQDVSELVSDPLLENLFSQVRAKAIQSELLLELPEVGFTFDPQHVWDSYEQIFIDSALLLREDIVEAEHLSKWIRQSAQAFEFLSGFLPDEQREILLINSALCYQMAGYRANAQCLARQVKAGYLSETEEDSYDQQLIRLLLATVVNFLIGDIPKLQEVADQALSRIQDAQSIVLESLENDTSAVEVYGLFAFAYFQDAIPMC